MDQVTKLAIFQAQVKNVRSLESAMRQIHRSINDGYRKNAKPQVAALTRVYAQMFCAWAEANFSKVLHTPYGFDVDEVEQVKAAKEDGISYAWKKCAELGLRHLDAKRGSFKPNAKQNLDKAIKDHVFDPSLLRNKLAHGQWVVALNRENDALNNEMTASLADLNIVKIDAWKKGHCLLASIVEDLIESPHRKFMRDWWIYVEDMKRQMVEAESRTIEQHVKNLFEKDKRTGAKDKR